MILTRFMPLLALLTLAASPLVACGGDEPTTDTPDSGASTKDSGTSAATCDDTTTFACGDDRCKTKSQFCAVVDGATRCMARKTAACTTCDDYAGSQEFSTLFYASCARKEVTCTGEPGQLVYACP